MRSRDLGAYPRYMTPTETQRLHVTLSGDVYLKSRRTQQRLISRARNNLGVALDPLPATIRRVGIHRYEITTEGRAVDDTVARLRTIFGFGTVEQIQEVPFAALGELAEVVAAATAHLVDGRTFAVRVKRRGSHQWRSGDLARAVGTLLVGVGGSVDLSNPDVTVRVSVLDEHAYVITDHWRGAGGLPLGTQDRVLCLLSGGFDSVVSAWMLMSRGCPADFVHFTLNCAQSDHALAVATELWMRWGHGTMPQVHLVEFQPVKDALVTEVDPSMRQVALKVMMARAADRIATEEAILALVTGDSMGQVSSQTLPHLAAVSTSTTTPILRPLVGMAKEAIIDLARVIGTADLSARAQEFCDLSEGKPVATSARGDRIARSVQRIPDTLMADAVATRKTFDLGDWSPGRI
jgi:tRNA uracil 4-sulfurtransferase